MDSRTGRRRTQKGWVSSTVREERTGGHDAK